MSSVQTSSARLFWLIVLSAVLPPVAVAVEFGVFHWDFLWNVLLTMLLPFGGFVHAVYLLTKARYERAQRHGYEPVGDEPTDRASVSRQESRVLIDHHPAIISEPTNQGGPSDVTHEPPPYTHSILDNKIQRQI